MIFFVGKHYYITGKEEAVKGENGEKQCCSTHRHTGEGMSMINVKRDHLRAKSRSFKLHSMSSPD